MPFPDTPIHTDAYDGFVARDALAEFVINQLVGGSPFARSLVPMPTERGGIAFPRVSPTGFGWVPEGGSIPEVDVGDDAYIVGLAKLAGIVALSNEMISDEEIPMSSMLGGAIADAMGPELDSGLLIGSGPPEPVGVLAAASGSATRPDFRSAVIRAWGELTDAGADGSSIVAFARGSVIADELARTDLEDSPIYDDNTAPVIGPGVRLIPVPSIAENTILVADVSRMWLVQKGDFEVEASMHTRFTNDETVLRIKGRFGCAVPAPAKTMRLATIEGVGS